MQKYVTKLGTKRTTATVGTTFTLDSANPVKIGIVAVNGKVNDNGTATSNENDLSVVAVIRFGNFDALTRSRFRN